MKQKRKKKHTQTHTEKCEKSYKLQKTKICWKLSNINDNFLKL